MNWPVTWFRWRAFSCAAFGRVGVYPLAPRSAQRCIRWPPQRTALHPLANADRSAGGGRENRAGVGAPVCINGRGGWLPSRCDRPGIDMRESPARPCGNGRDRGRGRRVPYPFKIRCRSGAGDMAMRVSHTPLPATPARNTALPYAHGPERMVGAFNLYGLFCQGCCLVRQAAWWKSRLSISVSAGCGCGAPPIVITLRVRH